MLHVEKFRSRTVRQKMQVCTLHKTKASKTDKKDTGVYVISVQQYRVTRNLRGTIASESFRDGSATANFYFLRYIFARVETYEELHGV